MKDFSARCEGIIEEAMKWAPGTTRSHLAEYLTRPAPGHHTGLALALEAGLHFAGPSPQAAPLAVSGAWRRLGGERGAFEWESFVAFDR